MNLVILQGRLGRDAELGYGKSGTAYCKLSVATSRYNGKDADGEPNYETDWHRVVCFGKTAESAGTGEKGANVLVQGEIVYEEYTNKDGQKVNSTKIIARTVKIFAPKVARPEIAPDTFPDTFEDANEVPF